MTSLLTIDRLNVQQKTVLVRVDLNVPMHAGKVTDRTRIERILPTIKSLVSEGARVVLLSHFGRPKGHYEPSLSLAPLVDELAAMLEGIEVRFGAACLGLAAHEAVEKTPFGAVLLLENLRFHPQEETGDFSFSQNLARLGDIYVNEAFSCSHRAHASIVGIPRYLPHAVGLAMQEEIETLESVFTHPERPVTAIVGGSKVSTKLQLLEHLVEKMDMLIIGGAMANTFLYALGHEMQASLYEANMKETALEVLAQAKQHDCEICLPVDCVATKEFAAGAANKVVPVDRLPEGHMVLDIGPGSIVQWAGKIQASHTVVWNGPLGAFETTPFDGATVQLARHVAAATARGDVKSVAGGGDTVAALAHAGLAEEFSYLSTAGGAFLEWLEGKILPGVDALLKDERAA